MIPLPITAHRCVHYPIFGRSHAGPWILGRLEVNRYLVDGRDILDIEHADSHGLVNDKALFTMYLWPSRYHPAFTLTRPTEGHGSAGHFDAPDDGCMARVGMICFKDSILRIAGDNRTAIYRIGDYHPECKAWEAHWPD